jgi:hypothetical protein
MAVYGPMLPTWPLQQVVGYLGYTGYRANADAMAAFAPQQTCIKKPVASIEAHNSPIVARYSMA